MSFLARIRMMIAGRGAAKRFEAATLEPREAQQRKLVEILQRNKDTEYGRKYGFGEIHTLEEYRERVPSVSYQDIRPLMDRVTRGERNVLVAETPVRFIRMADTSGDAGYIPVTPACLDRDHADQMLTWIHHAFRDHPAASKGRIAAIVSPSNAGATPSGIPCGTPSDALHAAMPAPVRARYAIPPEVFLIEDSDAKDYALMRVAIAQNVTMIAAAEPASIGRMCEVADANADFIITDVSHGTIRGDVRIDRTLREKIEAHLRPDPKLAHELAEMRRKRHLKLVPADYWSDLALIGCRKSGTTSREVEPLAAWFDPDGRGMVPIRDWGLLAAEGRSSLVLGDEGSAGVLSVAANVFEFVSASEVESGRRSTEWAMKRVEEIEDGHEYYIVLTTSGGLYRYVVNDVVKVVGRYNATPTIEFVRGGRQTRS